MAITKDVMMGKTLRKSFAKQDQILEIPNMLKIQKDSYEWFLREGLREVFRDVDTITDYTGNLELSFLDYSMNEPPKYSVEECKERDATYAKPIKVRVRLHNKETGEIKEQEIFMGDFPLMTNGGTFVAAPGWNTRPIIIMYSGSVSTKTASCPSPASSAPWVSPPTARSPGCSAKIRSSRPRWTRIRARRARNPCLRSTAACVRASRPQSKAPRAISTRCSSTPAATT